MNFIDLPDFQNLTSDLLAMIKLVIVDEKLGFGKFGDMSIKSSLAPLQESFLMCPNSRHLAIREHKTKMMVLA